MTPDPSVAPRAISHTVTRAISKMYILAVLSVPDSLHSPQSRSTDFRKTSKVHVLVHDQALAYALWLLKGLLLGFRLTDDAYWFVFTCSSASSTAHVLSCVTALFPLLFLSSNLPLGDFISISFPPGSLLWLTTAALGAFPRAPSAPCSFGPHWHHLVLC